MSSSLSIYEREENKGDKEKATHFRLYISLCRELQRLPSVSLLVADMKAITKIDDLAWHCTLHILIESACNRTKDVIPNLLESADINRNLAYFRLLYRPRTLNPPQWATAIGFVNLMSSSLFEK